MLDFFIQKGDGYAPACTTYIQAVAEHLLLRNNSKA
jgi:hypothetical protein